GSCTVFARLCVRPRACLIFGVTRRNTDSTRAPYPAVTAADPHCFGRRANDTSRQSTNPWSATVAGFVSVVAGTSTITGILTCFGLWVGATVITGGTWTCMVTPWHSSAAVQTDVPVAGSPSSHVSPGASWTSGGQARLLPSQTSARSHAVAAGRHT